LPALQEITAQIKTVGIDAGLDMSPKLSLKEDGVVFIDGGTVTITVDMRLP